MLPVDGAEEADSYQGVLFDSAGVDYWEGLGTRVAMGNVNEMKVGIKW